MSCRIALYHYLSLIYDRYFLADGLRFVQQV